MPERKLCPDCGGSLGTKATRCRCGWRASISVDAVPRFSISCCYETCLEGAICRVPTKTGWANVCRTHYPDIEIVRKRSNSAVVQEIRQAYEGSFAFRHKGQLHISRSLPGQRERQPGEDREEDLAA